MKKLLPSILALCLLSACGNDNTTKSESETGTTSGPGTPAVENVNGNIPDTSSGIRLNKPMPVDTLAKDSVRGPAANQH